MFLHKKEPIHTVDIGEAHPRFGQFLLDQFGGADGELSAALQYWVQSFHVEDHGIKDMLQDISVEEFSHLEMIGKLIEQHTKNADQTEAYNSTLFGVRGVGPHFIDSQGQAWNANYLNEGGSAVRDLRADIAAEAGARQTYEDLIKISPDPKTTETLRHLLTREISHTRMFMKALESMDKLTDPMFGDIKPDETVDIYYNLSSDGKQDQRGPWNSDDDFRYIADPAKEMTS